MTPEERLTRLEDAFDTIAQLSVETKSQTDILIELARNAYEHLGTHGAWINQLGEAQANSEAKIAALADSQIRLEDSHIRLEESHLKLEEAHLKLEEAQARTEAALKRLAESQAHGDRRLDALIDIVRKERNDES